MKNKPFKNILVVGLGLIGGSIIKNLLNKKENLSIYGLDINLDIVKKANNLGLIKNRTNTIGSLDQDSLMIFSVPPLSIKNAIDLVEQEVDVREVIFTDTLSVKSGLLNVLESYSDIRTRFVMSHPIAGSEKSGLKSSKPLLFEDKLVVVSALEDLTQSEYLKRICNFWESLGSRIILLDKNDHDRIFSMTSHLPHVIAYALTDFLLNQLGKKTFIYSGGSLEDYTRISSSDARMWKDIMVSNKDDLIEAMEGFAFSLDKIIDLIRSKDEQSLEELLNSIKLKRDKLIDERD